MQDLVSTRWIRVSGLVAPLAVPFGIFAFTGAAWMAWLSLGWLVLAVSASVWLGSRSSNRSVQQMLDDLEGAPTPAVARAPGAPLTCKNVH